MGLENVDDSFTVFVDVSNDPPDEEAEDGLGGDDMFAWQLPRVDQYRALLYSGYDADTNQSSHSFEAGIVDLQRMRFSVGIDDGELDNGPPDNEAEDGTGGDDMAAWDPMTRLSQYRDLLYTGYHPASNQSSHTFEKGIVDLQHARFDIGTGDGELHIVAPDSVVETGAGGDMLATYIEDRDTQLEDLIHASFGTIEASVDLPSAIVPAGGWEYGIGSSERPNGIGVEGTVSDHNNLPLSGRIDIIAGEEHIASYSVTGAFQVAFPPPPGVASGADHHDAQQHDLWFSPDGDGLLVEEEDIQPGQEFDFRYFALVGEITDADGEPVEGDTVLVGTNTFQTDDDGLFQFVAPEGTQVEIAALNQTVLKEAEVGDGDRLEFQYGGVQVFVQDPADASPVESAPVQIGDRLLTTDSQGEAYVAEAGLGIHDVSVMGYFDFQLQVNSQAHVATRTVGDPDEPEDEFNIEGAAVRAFDAQTGRPILDLPVRIPALGIRSETDELGRVTMFHDLDADEEDVRLVVGVGDPRYRNVEFELDPEDEVSWNWEIELRPTTQSVNH